MSKVLITGGCGYIGSHTIVDLIENGHDVISVDNYLNSDPIVIDHIEEITGKKIVNYPVDLVNSVDLEQVFKENDIKAVIHFAALKAVGESVDKPLLYYRNNISGMINLMESCLKHKVKHIIFSSSCTVYGESDDLPVTEETEIKRAESPYGYTKQVCERIIEDSLKNHEINGALLRYFNPAGAHESLKMGESPINPPLNLIPVITEVATGKREKLQIFGEDYDTRDGSCIRDYIHVMDLASAHTKALSFLEKGELAYGSTEVFNLGTGQGVSVKEAVHAFETVSEKKLHVELVPRRSGDIAAMYANYDKAKTMLEWEPKRNIVDIMKTAWAWEQKRREE